MNTTWFLVAVSLSSWDLSLKPETATTIAAFESQKACITERDIAKRERPSRTHYMCSQKEIDNIAKQMELRK
jgi:hypothetical protein